MHFFSTSPQNLVEDFLIWCFGDLIKMHGGKKGSVAICVRLNLTLTGLYLLTTTPPTFHLPNNTTCAPRDITVECFMFASI